MAHRPGLDVNGPIETCMVAGCVRRALYRHPQTRSGRGYCSTHRSLAVGNGANDRERRSERLVAHLERLAVQE